MFSAWQPVERKDKRITTLEIDPDPDDGFNYKQMMVRDERRFKMADKDGDLIATKEEFTAFLHPEEYDYMKDIVVQVGGVRARILNGNFLFVAYAFLFSLSSVFRRTTCYTSAGQIESKLCHCFSVISMVL